MYDVDVDGSSLLHLAANSGVLAVSEIPRVTANSRVEPLLTETSIIRTPLYYVQSTWSERDQIPSSVQTVPL